MNYKDEQIASQAQGPKSPNFPLLSLREYNVDHLSLHMQFQLVFH